MATQQPAPEFIGGIGAALAYWQRQMGVESVAELDRERHNLYRVVRFGLALPQTQLASAEVSLQAFPLILSRGYWREWLPVLEEAVRVCPLDQPWLRFKLLNRLGHLWRLTRRLNLAIAAHEEAALLAPQLGSEVALAEVNYYLARAYFDARNNEEAERYASAVLKLLPDEPNPQTEEWRVSALNTLGRISRSRGELAAAVGFFQQAVAIARQYQDGVRLAGELQDLGDTYRRTEQYDEALACYDEAISLLWSASHLLNRILVQYNMGVLHFSRRQWTEAEAVFRQIDLLYLQETGNTHHQAMILTALGNTLLYQGRPAEAAVYLRKVVALWQQMEDELELANALGSLGEALAAQGKQPEAATQFDDALALLAKFPDNARAKRLRELFATEQGKLVEVGTLPR